MIVRVEKKLVLLGPYTDHTNMLCTAAESIKRFSQVWKAAAKRDGKLSLCVRRERGLKRKQRLIPYLGAEYRSRESTAKEKQKTGLIIKEASNMGNHKRD